MKIELKEVTIRELVEDYTDDGEGGVTGYGGNLDIRPPFQREFVYKDKQRNAVIETIQKGFPLNVMYWAVRKDGTYEIIDGQQRTISIAQYVDEDFSVNEKYFDNLPSDKKKQILDYKLMIYVCSGEDSEKLDWFETINIAGEELSDQELRNAVYAGPWVTDAKRYFSRTGCPAHSVGSRYLSGDSIRQHYLERAIKWISEDNIVDYMGQHQHEPSAVKLWNYFRSVITWVETIFTNYRPSMKGVDWGFLYNEFKNKKLDPEKIEEEVDRLELDDDVTKKSGIYPYILTRSERHLSIRAFTKSMRHKVYRKQEEKCANCEKKFKLKEMEADHIKPWSEGGRTIEENCRMLCKECHYNIGAG